MCARWGVVWCVWWGVGVGGGLPAPWAEVELRKANFEKAEVFEGGTGSF